jgi:hypothetical protein
MLDRGNLDRLIRYPPLPPTNPRLSQFFKSWIPLAAPSNIPPTNMTASSFKTNLSINNDVGNDCSTVMDDALVSETKNNDDDVAPSSGIQTTVTATTAAILVDKNTKKRASPESKDDIGTKKVNLKQDTSEDESQDPNRRIAIATTAGAEAEAEAEAVGDKMDGTIAAIDHDVDSCGTISDTAFVDHTSVVDDDMGILPTQASLTPVEFSNDEEDPGDVEDTFEHIIPVEQTENVKDAAVDVVAQEDEVEYMA